MRCVKFTVIIRLFGPPFNSLSQIPLQVQSRTTACYQATRRLVQQAGTDMMPQWNVETLSLQAKLLQLPIWLGLYLIREARSLWKYLKTRSSRLEGNINVVAGRLSRHRIP